MPYLSSPLEHGPDPGRRVLGDQARHAPDAHQRAGHRAGHRHPDRGPDGRGRHPDPDTPAGRDELLVPVLHAQMATPGPAAGQEPDQVAAAPRVALDINLFISVKPARRPTRPTCPTRRFPYRLGWPFVTAASSVPSHTTWMPLSCCSSCMNAAPMQYERARPGRQATYQWSQKHLDAHEHQTGSQRRVPALLMIKPSKATSPSNDTNAASTRYESAPGPLRRRIRPG